MDSLPRHHKITPELKLAWDFLFLARLFAALRVKFLNYLEGNLSGLAWIRAAWSLCERLGFTRYYNIGESEHKLQARFSSAGKIER